MRRRTQTLGFRYYNPKITAELIFDEFLQFAEKNAESFGLSPQGVYIITKKPELVRPILMESFEKVAEVINKKLEEKEAKKAAPSGKIAELRERLLDPFQGLTAEEKVLLQKAIDYIKSSNFILTHFREELQKIELTPDENALAQELYDLRLAGRI